MLLDEPETKICAVIRALVRCQQSSSPDMMKTIAGDSASGSPCPRRCGSAGCRNRRAGIVQSSVFGKMRTAQCLMVRDMLSLTGIDSELNCSRKGGGGERALLEKVCELITEGYNWWWTPDVKTCFASIKPGHFRWLPIDRRILKNVIFLPKCAEIEADLKVSPSLYVGVSSPTTSDGPAGPTPGLSSFSAARQRCRRAHTAVES